jgi:hypothetical protein
MARRIYIMPMVPGGGDGRPGNWFRPKIFPVSSWATMFGAELVCMLVSDVDDATHEIISADSDVLAFPEKLAANLSSAAVTVVKAFLDGHRIPSQWVSTSLTYSQVAKGIWKIFTVGQKLRSSLGSIFSEGDTLATTWQQLPRAKQNGLRAVAEKEGWDASGIAAGTTVRQILKAIADQLPDPRSIYGVSV